MRQNPRAEGVTTPAGIMLWFGVRLFVALGFALVLLPLSLVLWRVAQDSDGIRGDNFYRVGIRCLLHLCLWSLVFGLCFVWICHQGSCLWRERWEVYNVGGHVLTAEISIGDWTVRHYKGGTSDDELWRRWNSLLWRPVRWLMPAPPITEVPATRPDWADSLGGQADSNCETVDFIRNRSVMVRVCGKFLKLETSHGLEGIQLVILEQHASVEQPDWVAHFLSLNGPVLKEQARVKSHGRPPVWHGWEDGGEIVSYPQGGLVPRIYEWKGGKCIPKDG